MKRIYALFISLMLFVYVVEASEPDTLPTPKAIIIGAELLGPTQGFFDSDIISYEGYISYRLSHKYFITAEAGYADFYFEQYNYRYNCNGVFIRAGTDINLLKPKEKPNNHFIGIGIKYGLSLLSQETPWLKLENYWGTSDSNIPKTSTTAHFVQLSLGIKTELFKNILIGWSVRSNVLINQGGGKSNKPVYIPGMGNADSNFKPSMVFHIAWMVPFRSN